MKTHALADRAKPRLDSLLIRFRHGLPHTLAVLALVVAAHQPVSAKDNAVGDLFGLGTSTNAPPAKEPATSSSDTGALFGLEPSAPKTSTGNQGTGSNRDVIGDALAEHDRRLLDQATRDLDNANSRVGKHCDCVLSFTNCANPWSSDSWDESSSFTRQLDDYQQSRDKLCRDWQKLTDSSPSDTIEGIKGTTAKVQMLAQRLDSQRDEINSAATTDRRRAEREEEDRRIEEERLIARQQESDDPGPLTNWAREMEAQNKRNYEQVIRQNDEFARNAQHEIDRRQRERAEAQRRAQEERARQMQQQRYQQQAAADAAQAREKERLERERQRRLEAEKQKQMEEERRKAELERQRQQEAERQAKLERERKLEAERQAQKAAKEQAQRDYLSAVARGTQAKAILCPAGEIHAIVKPARVTPEVVSCIDVYWTAYCPGDSRGVDGVTTNAIRYNPGCYGDSKEIRPKPRCAAEQIRVEVREVRRCGE